MSTSNPTTFTLTAFNYLSNKISSRNTAIAQLSKEDLLAVKTDAINSRIRTEERRDYSYHRDKENLVDKFIQRRFWKKPWTWHKKNQIIKPTDEQIRKVEEDYQQDTSDITRYRLMEHLCELYLLNQNEGLEGKFFHYLNKLDANKQKFFEYELWLSIKLYEDNASEFRDSFFLIEQFSRRLLELQTLEYWITN